MLNLLKILDNNDELLVNLLKIDKIYKSTFANNNLTMEILKLDNFNNIDNIDIKITKGIEIVKSFYEDKNVLNFNKLINTLKIKELYINNNIYADKYVVVVNNFLKKLKTTNMNIIFIRNNLTFLNLKSCKTNNIKNFSLLIHLLNNTSQNLKTLIIKFCDLDTVRKQLFNSDDEADINKFNINNEKINIKLKVNKYDLDNKIKLLNLKCLIIIDTRFSYINLESLSNLEYLTIKYSNILDKIDGLTKLTKLTKLNLEYNSLSSINLDGLIELRNLSLYQNYLINIDGLSSLTNLISLNLSKNKLQDIENLTNLINLKNLNLSYNNFKELNIEKLTNLENLYLQNNRIERLNLNSLINLKILNLSTNKFFDIVNIPYLDLTNIIELDLSNNYLCNVNVSNLTKLEYLNLEKNELEELDTNILINMKTMNLSNNKFKIVELANLNKIQYLYLFHNELTQLDVKNSIDLHCIDVRDNPIKEIFIDSSKIYEKCVVKYNRIGINVRDFIGFNSNILTLN